MNFFKTENLFFDVDKLIIAIMADDNIEVVFQDAPEKKIKLPDKDTLKKEFEAISGECSKYGFAVSNKVVIKPEFLESVHIYKERSLAIKLKSYERVMYAYYVNPEKVKIEFDKLYSNIKEKSGK